MEYELRDIALALICDRDHTFHISTRPLPEALPSSIERIGLINRPILLEDSGGYLIVSGFARIAACRRLAWSAVPANCLRADTPRHMCALTAVADNAFQRALDVVEQARACALLARFFAAPHELIAAGNAVGLMLNADLIEKLLRIHGMHANLQSALIEGSIALPTALRISAHPEPSAADGVVALLRQLKVSLSRQKELLDWIEGIQMREGISVADLLAEEPLARWRADLSLDAPRRASLIRQYLKKRRYPTITQFESRYDQAAKKLALGQGIELSPPPHFEGRTFSIKLDFSSSAELMKHAVEIQRLSQTSTLADLLDQKLFSNRADTD